MATLSCPTCAEEISTPAGLDFHQKYKLCRYKCSNCERKFCTVAEVTAHENQTHGRTKSQTASGSLEMGAKSDSSSCISLKEDLEEWKQDSSLPLGWKVLATNIKGKNCERFLSPNSVVYSSRDYVLKIIKKKDDTRVKNEGVVIKGDLEKSLCKVDTKFDTTKTVSAVKDDKVYKIVKAIANVQKIDVSYVDKLIKSNESDKIYSHESSPTSNNTKLKPYQNGKPSKMKWIEDDPSVPPGWKIRIKESAGVQFLAKGGTKKESFLSPSGKLFSSRKAMLHHLVKDENTSIKDINVVEEAMDQAASTWKLGSPSVPDGWKTRKMKGREMFQSPIGETFLAREAVLEHLVSAGAPVQEIIKVEKGPAFWHRDKDLPGGWMARNVRGLDHSKEKSLFKSPSGDIFLGFDKAILESNSRSATYVVEHARVSVTSLDDTLADMLEPIVDLKEYSENLGWKNVDKDGDVFVPTFKPFDDNMIASKIQDDDSDAISLSDDEVEEILEIQDQESSSTFNAKIVENNSFSTEEIDKIDDQSARTGRELNLTKSQLEILELAYNEWPHPFDKLVDELVKETGLKAKDIKKWFRAKTLKQVTRSKAKHKGNNSGNNPDRHKVEGQKSIIKSTEMKNTGKAVKKLDKSQRNLLMASFKSDPDTPKEQRLDFLIKETGLPRLHIQQWFSNRRRSLSKINSAFAKPQTIQNVSSNSKYEKSSRKSNKYQWIQDPTLPPNWMFCRVNGNLLFRSPEGQQFNSRMDVIKSFHN